jgi:hypothetical protein
MSHRGHKGLRDNDIDTELTLINTISDLPQRPLRTQSNSQSSIVNSQFQSLLYSVSCILFSKLFFLPGYNKGIILINYLEDATEDGSNIVCVETGA